IAVTEGHPIFTLFDHVLLVESVLRAPAKVDALGAALHSIFSHDRTLRSGPRVNRQPGAIIEVAVFHLHIVRNAPDDAVAVEIPHCDPRYGDPTAIVQPDAAVVERPLIDHLIAGLVSIDSEILDGHIRDTGALNKCE